MAARSWIIVARRFETITLSPKSETSHAVTCRHVHEEMPTISLVTLRVLETGDVFGNIS